MNLPIPFIHTVYPLDFPWYVTHLLKLRGLPYQPNLDHECLFYFISHIFPVYTVLPDKEDFGL